VEYLSSPGIVSIHAFDQSRLAIRPFATTGPYESVLKAVPSSGLPYFIYLSVMSYASQLLVVTISTFLRAGFTNLQELSL
jgi:hypothetical protein